MGNIRYVLHSGAYQSDYKTNMTGITRSANIDRQI